MRLTDSSVQTDILFISVLLTCYKLAVIWFHTHQRIPHRATGLCEVGEISLLRVVRCSSRAPIVFVHPITPYSSVRFNQTLGRTQNTSDWLLSNNNICYFDSPSTAKSLFTVTKAHLVHLLWEGVVAKYWLQSTRLELWNCGFPLLLLPAGNASAENWVGNVWNCGNCSVVWDGPFPSVERAGNVYTDS